MTDHDETPSHQPEDKLDDLFSMEGYDKPVRNARIVLFILAALQLVGLLTSFSLPEAEKIASIVVYVFLTLLFVALAFWTKQKPFTAIVTALIIYTLLIVASAIVDPATILQGWIVKIVVFVLLINSVNNAREVQRWKESQK